MDSAKEADKGSKKKSSKQKKSSKHKSKKRSRRSVSRSRSPRSRSRSRSRKSRSRSRSKNSRSKSKDRKKKKKRKRSSEKRSSEKEVPKKKEVVKEEKAPTAPDDQKEIEERRARMRAWLNKKKDSEGELTFIKTEPIDEPKIKQEDPTPPPLESPSQIKTEPSPKKLISASSMKLNASKKKNIKLNFGLNEEEDTSTQKKKLRPKPEDLLLDEKKIKVKQEESGMVQNVPFPDVDPLDAYMMSLTTNMSDEEKLSVAGKAHSQQEGTGEDLSQMPGTERKPKKAQMRYFGDEEQLGEEEVVAATEEPSWLTRQKVKKKDLKNVDHAKMDYIPFTKRFYIEAREIAAMTEAEVAEYRKEQLEGVKIIGKDCPKPIKKWSQCGLSKKVMAVIEKSEYESPFPIQCQAIPAIMSGRDVIGCAKTGSGKTLAFLLPMMRHVMDQPPLTSGDGPIGLIMSPTRELCAQIYSEAKKFAKPCGLRSVCVYGGASVAEQINRLKGGAEIVVCTPGRMIDLLCANSGRVTNLKRVTYLVLDEADRMFDMGFEPQIMRIVENTRPDRQTVMFSATFPKTVEKLAKVALSNPLEIVIGGKSTASGDVKQIIEVREESQKFHRLLEILGKWYQLGQNILIFVDKQEHVDTLFRQLSDSGYPCLALHGGMDQTDRDFTISDYKSKLRTLMVATSVVARGLDIKDLVLVINYTVPNHYEDYVHRVGRTGRAGKKGTAITFITPDEDRFAPDLCKALKQSSGQTVPEDLQKLADGFADKLRQGLVKYGSNSGYRSGKGFKFDETEAAEAKVDELEKRSGYLDQDERGADALNSLVDEKYAIEAKKQEEKEREKATKAKFDNKADIEDPIAKQLAAAKKAAQAAASALTGGGTTVKEGEQTAGATPDAIEEAKKAVQTHTAAAAAEMSKIKARTIKQGVVAAREFAKNLGMKQDQGKIGIIQTGNPSNPELSYEQFEINDYPQHARWRVTHRDSMREVMDLTDTSITVKGIYVPPGRKPLPGEQKLYLLVEGKTNIATTRAIQELRRICEEAALNARPQKDLYSKYSVL